DTVRNMRQNLGFAFLYNAIGVPVAAGVLYPTFGLLLSPMLAALAMSLRSVSVITNALRLGRGGANHPWLGIIRNMRSRGWVPGRPTTGQAAPFKAPSVAKPAPVASKDPPTCNPTWASAQPYCWRDSSSKASAENAENVVSAPRKPVTTNSRTCGDTPGSSAN